MDIKNTISNILLDSGVDFNDNEISNIHILLLTLAECEHSFYMTNQTKKDGSKAEIRDISPEKNKKKVA